jgi:hypothetical protein
MVGVSLMLQQTPLVVIVKPPSDLMTPPLTAVTWVISVTSLVERTGSFLSLSSFLQLVIENITKRIVGAAKSSVRFILIGFG